MRSSRKRICGAVAFLSLHAEKQQSGEGLDFGPYFAPVGLGMNDPERFSAFVK